MISGKVKKLGRLSNGENCWVLEGNHERWVFFQGDDGTWDDTTGQRIAPDSLHYGYTHGGELYREACEMYWKKCEGKEN